MRTRDSVSTAPGIVSTSGDTAASLLLARLPGGLRERRRGVFGAGLAMFVATCLALAAHDLGLGHSSGSKPHSVATSSLFASQPPYVGVACRYSNSTDCGRIGVAVWFRHRPSSVTALLGNHPVALRSASRGGKVFTYIAYVRVSAAALGIPSFWTGVPPRRFTLRIFAHRGARVERRTFRVQLHPGWG